MAHAVAAPLITNTMDDTVINKSDIIKYLLGIEQPINHKSLSVKDWQRKLLVKWLWDVADRWQQQTNCMFLAVHLLDLFFSKNTVQVNEIQLVGITSLVIGCKFYGTEGMAPSTEDAAYITADSYDVQQVVGMEMKILEVCEFNLSLPLVSQFFDVLVDQGIVKNVLHGYKLLRELTVDQEMFNTGYKPSELAKIIQQTADGIPEEQWEREYPTGMHDLVCFV